MQKEFFEPDEGLKVIAQTAKVTCADIREWIKGKTNMVAGDDYPKESAMACSQWQNSTILQDEERLKDAIQYFTDYWGKIYQFHNEYNRGSCLGESFFTATIIDKWHWVSVKMNPQDKVWRWNKWIRGHANIDSVHFYRIIGNKVMAAETREARRKMDEILLNIVKDWDGYKDIAAEYSQKTNQNKN